MMKQAVRRSGFKIMASLIVLLGSLSYIMLFAVLNGTLGFVCSMGVTILGAIGIAKLLGETISMSYGLIMGLAIGFGVLRGLLRYIEQYNNHYIAFRLLATLRDKIFSALRILCPAKLEGKQKGNIISMITSDIETLEVFYAHTISPICIAIVVSIGSVLFIGFMSSWYLAIVAFVAYIIIGIISPIIISKTLKKDGVKYRQKFGKFNAFYLDSIKGIRDIVLHNGEDNRESEVNRRSKELLDENKKIKRKTSFSASLVELTISVIMIVSLIVGIVLVSNNLLTVGKMVIGVVTIFSSFGPVVAISNLPSNLNQTFASGDRILNLLEEKPQVYEIKDKKDFDFEKLEIKDLSFKYQDVDVLEDVNMTVNKGEIVGIIGESGSGKSTILKLLLRFYDKDKGNINFNGDDITDINTSSLLDNVTMVSQSTYLFDDTIFNNIRIAKLDATKEEVIEACKKASIHDLIMELENGYDTPVGTLGDNLSAGEKQRIGIARAFLRGSNLILLDEPTSNVDCINEGIILKAIKEQKKNHSFILVSHRPSTMKICDRIYSMDKGVLKEVEEN